MALTRNFRQIPGFRERSCRAHIYRDDLLVETRKSPLIFGDQLRIEGRQPVARNLELDLASLGENRFSTISIPAIGVTVLLAFVEMMIDLGVQGSEHADGCTFDTRLSS
jgi:hypothetical protein